MLLISFVKLIASIPFLSLYVAFNVVAFDDEATEYSGNILHYGATEEMRARNLFAVLRELDDIGAKKVYIHSPQKKGVGLAVYNRLIRAAGFEVVRL